jgi:hypothetical protein
MRNDQRTGLKNTCIRTTLATTADTAALTADNYRFCILQVHINASGGGKTAVVQVQDSDDGVSYQNVGSAVTIAGATAETSGTILIDHQKTRRYVRANVAPGGSAQTSVNAVQFNEIVTPDAVSNVSLAVL